MCGQKGELVMAAKIDQTKRQKKVEKRMKVDKITNWLMINLAWGILSLIILRYLETTIMIYPTRMLIPAIGFGVISVALFVLGGVKVIKNKVRAFNYGIFSAVAAIFCLYLTFFAKIRYALGAFGDTRWWMSWGPSLAIAVYLLGAFVFTAIKITKIEKSK